MAFRTVMLEPPQCEGVWWLASNKDEKTFGRIFIEDEQIFLETYASTGTADILGRHPQEVHGAVVGKHLTLLELVYAGGIETPFFRKTRYAVRYGLSGGHLSAGTTIRSMCIEFSDLDMSLTNNMINWDFSESGEASYRIKAVPEKRICLPELSLEIQIKDWVQHRGTGHDINLRQVTSFHLLKTSGDNLSWFIEKAYHLRHLISIFHGHATIFLSMSIQTDDFDCIEVFFNQDRRNRSVDTQAPQFIPFRLLSEDQLVQIISTWYNDWLGRMIPVFLLFRTTYGAVSHSKSNFINYCQALEAFHRLFIGGEYLTKEEYATHLSVMIESIPKEFSSSLRSRLKSALSFGYEFSQRKRFADLLERLPDALKNRIASTPGRYVDRIIETRNFLTHSGEFDSSKTISDNDLEVANFGLATWLHCEILLELGLAGSFIDERLTSLSCYRNYLSFSGAQLFS